MQSTLDTKALKMENCQLRGHATYIQALNHMLTDLLIEKNYITTNVKITTTQWQAF